MPDPVLISGAMVLADGEVLKRGDILVERGKIRRIAPKIAARGKRVVRGRDLLAAPGLIDTQLNGGFGLSFSAATPDQILEVGRRLLAHGVTSYLPTLISLPRDQTHQAITNLVAAAPKTGGARILGIHMEGPFLSPDRRGAHRAENLRAPSVEEFREYLRAARGWLRMMTIAPEQPGALEVIREGAKNGVIMSAGHSMATAGDVIRAVTEGGLRHVTHVFNAMAPLHHRQESILNAALLFDRLSCGMIYDRRHLSAGTAMLLLRVKPVGTLLLVSDATAAFDAPDGVVEADGERYLVEKGRVTVAGSATLAGTAVSLRDCVQWLTADTNVPVNVAVYMASGAPAALLGLRRKKGFLRPGADADIVLFDDGMRVRKTFVEGELLYGDRD